MSDSLDPKLIDNMMKRPVVGLLVVGALIVLALAWRGGWPFGGRGAESPPGTTTNIGTVNGPAQVGGQGNTMVVGDPPAYFQREVRLEPYQSNGLHGLRVHFVPKGGAWRPGVQLEFHIRLRQPCARWRIDPEGRAFGGSMLNVMMGATENTDDIAFSTRSSPAPGVGVVFAIEAVEPPEIVGTEASSLEPSPS